jgi:hypothetical protein
LIQSQAPLKSIFLLALTSVFILRCAPAQYLGRQQDDLVYIIASHALSHGSYRFPTVPGHPPLTMMTPGFPAILLPLTLSFDEWMPAYQIFCALVAAATPWLYWLWLRRRIDDDATSVLAAVTFGTSPILLSQSGSVMTETLYTALSFVLLFALERARAAGGSFLLLLMTQLRPAGLAAVPAALIRPLRERRWKDAAKMAAPAAAAMAFWFWWSSSVSSGMEKVVELKVFYSGQGLSQVAAVAQDNLKYYLSSWGASYLPEHLASGPPALILGGVLFFLSVVGLLMVLWRDWLDPAAWMLLGGLALHAIWSWHYERYLIPLLPLLLWTAIVALDEEPRIKLCALLIAQIAFQSHHWLSRTAWSKIELAQTYGWLKANTSSADILSSALYVRDGYYAARPSLPLPDSPRPEVFSQTLEKWRVKYVVWQDGLDIGLSLGRTSPNHRMLDRAGHFLKDDPGRYRLVYENRGEKARVYGLAGGL